MKMKIIRRFGLLCALLCCVELIGAKGTWNYDFRIIIIIVKCPSWPCVLVYFAVIMRSVDGLLKSWSIWDLWWWTRTRSSTYANWVQHKFCPFIYLFFAREVGLTYAWLITNRILCQKSATYSTWLKNQVNDFVGSSIIILQPQMNHVYVVSVYGNVLRRNSWNGYSVHILVCRSGKSTREKNI